MASRDACTVGLVASTPDPRCTPHTQREVLPSQAHDPALLSHARQPSDCTFVVDYLYLLNFEGGGVIRFDPAEPASADHGIS